MTPSVCELIDERIRHQPGAMLASDASGSVSAGDLLVRADALAAALLRRGVAPGDRVAIWSEPRREWPAALLATWRAGAVAVPCDPAWGVERTRATLRQTHVTQVLTTRSRLVVLGRNGPGGGVPAALPLDGPVALPGRPVKRARLDLAAPAAWLVADGGVQLAHETLRQAVTEWTGALPVRASDRLLLAAPPSSVAGLLGLLASLAHGAHALLHRWLVVRDLPVLAAAGQASGLVLTPRLLDQVSQLHWPACPSLRWRAVPALPVTRGAVFEPHDGPGLAAPRSPAAPPD